MKFEYGPPSSFGNGHTAPFRSSTTKMTTAESRRSIKAGSFPLNRIDHTEPLRKIAQELAAARQERAADDLLNREFPFQIEAYTLPAGESRLLRGRQSRLGLLFPLSGLLRVEAGARPVDLCAGEILIASDLNMLIKARPGESQIEVLVISFLPRFVYSLGSPSHDYFFLLPFYANYGVAAPVVREGPSLRELHQAIVRLVRCYLDRMDYFEVGCKAHFLELLYSITRQFRDAESIRAEMIFHTARAAQFAPLLEFVESNHPRLITLKEAAALAKMSVPQFVRLFKRVAGMSFVSYVTHVRLSRATRLLKESSLTIAQIACEVGFSDQSYFDRRFKQAFGQTPREFRRDFAEAKCGFKRSARALPERPSPSILRGSRSSD